ncbi:hypothetical protein DQ04_10171010 [Trypanosoma grayi]|uniref:hypothetical protein n=1 Tax=Trypanosoma grayi TaxID=71804 RepID=UPI0004F4A191|nr:hypothetical protein DQ04_10171010 [Trypanosoma grayi]KEG07325.1 hypothetical protein DQ04_10171010 [Trypanosoma grayi]
MLRSRRPVTVLHAADRWLVRSYASTVTLLQLQARERLILGTHGAGIVRHDSMSQQTGSNLPSSVTVAAPAADLFRTKVHEGTGTGERDPYMRTLPNQKSTEPESSVARANIMLAPTVDECIALNTKWGSMHYWLGDQFPRLSVYLKQLQVPDVPPLSPAAEALLSKFETGVIPRLASDEVDREKLTALWKDVVRQADALVQEHICDRTAFESKLSRVCDDAVQQLRTLSLVGSEGILAVEALRRRTLIGRNKLIQEHLIDVTENGAYLGFGDAVWQVFFRAVESSKAEFLSERAPKALRVAWDAIMREDVVRLPDVTAPVALYLTLVCIDESGRLAVGDLKESSSSLCETVRPCFKEQQPPPLNLLNPVVKRRFVARTVAEMLQAPSSNAFSKALREDGQHDVSRVVALCEAMSSSHKLFEDDVADAVGRFESTSEVKTLLSSLMGGTDAAVRDTVSNILGVTGTTAVNWDVVMQSVDWTNNWRQLATGLLSDPGVLVAVHKHVKNAIGAKGVSKHLFTEEYAEQLQLIVNAREEREVSRKLKIENVVQELSSYQKVDHVCHILRQLGVDMTELDQAAASILEKGLVKRPHVDEGVKARVLEAVAGRHPNWVQVGVVQPTVKDSVEALRCMLHIFIRLAYVPQAGAAAIAQRSRRRIGLIGLEPHQFNVPTEVGFVEQYDNLQYKRYDWQGWYQRMVDVHNRNVSLRCRIDDLKRIDGNGVPFVDMQTERRLRILAQEHVGMGVLKLDSDKYEDQADNMTFGAVKLSELLADARKAQLGEEYWPSVELKVRKPSGQSKAHYSLIDYDRVENRSKELYEKYRDAKKKSLFVTPMDMWLDVKGMQVRKATESADTEGYTVDTLQDVLGSEESERGL